VGSLAVRRHQYRVGEIRISQDRDKGLRRKAELQFAAYAEEVLRKE
jgi:hypothetical protein